MKQLHLFGTETQLEKLSRLGEPQKKINALIDREMFRNPPETAIRKDMSKGGRSPCSYIDLHICAKAFRNNPLTEDDKIKNRSIARTRASAEHIADIMMR